MSEAVEADGIDQPGGQREGQRDVVDMLLPVFVDDMRMRAGTELTGDPRDGIFPRKIAEWRAGRRKQLVSINRQSS